MFRVALSPAASSTATVGSRAIYNYAYKVAKKVMPKISDTERAALESGTIGFDMALFSGDPAAYDIDGKYRMPKLSAEEQAFLDNEVETVCKMIDDYSTIKNGDMSKEVWDYMRKNKFFGLIIDKEWGGLGMSEHGHALVVSKVASRSPAAGSTVAVPSSLGPGALLKRFGTREQQEYYLPRLAAGQEIPCFALTGPSSGSDATSMRDVGVIEERDGVLGMVANFSKRYITLAPVASVVGLAVDVKDPNGLLKGVEGATEGITVALLPRSHPGLEMGPRHDPLAVPFMNGTVQGEDVWIPLDLVLGGPKRTGFGWNMLTEQLSCGRGVSLPAMSLAAAKLSTNAVGAYARVRKQFKVPIAELEGVQELLARIGSQTYVMTAGQAFFNAMLDQHHEEPAVLSAVMKQQFTNRMRSTVNDAMDILGGAGICMGPSNFMASAHMAAPIGVTVEGSNVMTRSLLQYGSGLIRSHPHMLKMIHAIERGDDVKGFAKELNAMAMHGVTNLAGSVVSGVFRNRSKSNLEAYYEAQLARLARNFALTTDATLVLGGKLKFKEMVSGRMADVLSSLYLGNATLWYYKQNKVEGAESMLEHAMDTLLVDAQEALYGVYDNFPVAGMGLALKAMTFPLGKSYEKPTDKLTTKVSSLITHDTPIRNHLANNVFIHDDVENDRVAMLNAALSKAVQADEALKAARKASRDLTAAEQAIVDEAEALREQIIQVDSYQNFGPKDEDRPALHAVGAPATASA